MNIAFFTNHVFSGNIVCFDKISFVLLKTSFVLTTRTHTHTFFFSKRENITFAKTLSYCSKSYHSVIGFRRKNFLDKNNFQLFLNFAFF